MENNEPMSAANDASNAASGANESRMSNAPLSQAEYLASAKAAVAAGDDVLGMHLYLAAYETQSQNTYPPTSETIDALRSAWKLAITLKERSIAEYIFEKIEPFITAQEMGKYADELQQLALDRLEQFGLSREELEQMAEAISDDFFGGPLGSPSVHIEQFTIPAKPTTGNADDYEEADPELADDFNQLQENFLSTELVVNDKPADASASLMTPASVVQNVAKAAAGSAGADVSTTDDATQDKISEQDAQDKVAEKSASEVPEAPKVGIAHEKYADLVGYNAAIEAMRGFGVGVKGDAEFEEFVRQLNELHGVDRMPAVDSLLFQAAVHEDADRFLEATIREIDLPVIRMSFEESIQGVPMLVVASEGVDFRGRQSFMRMGFTSPMTLVLEDIDLWMAPDIDLFDDHASSNAQESALRGAREAVNIIRSAVENPDVYVLASASNLKEVAPFFFDLLEPASIVEIDLPTDDERMDIWLQLLEKHSSLELLPIDDLVKLSVGLSRYDIVSAAREAIEEAYKLSLITRKISKVSVQNIFEKIAGYQPLDSEEYKQLEDKVLTDFRSELDNLNDLFGQEH